VKPIRRHRRSPDSGEWPFAVTRKAYASVFTSNLVAEVLTTWSALTVGRAAALAAPCFRLAN
jgi:hypothetical protein